MIPLTNITLKNRLRVDTRTSVWMLGKLLKLLAFAHSQNIAVGLLGGNNILIEPHQHYILIFDWLNAEMYPGPIPTLTQRKEIVQVTTSILTVMGRTAKGIPNDGDETLEPYIEYLLRLARGEERSAKSAHAHFYELADSLWKRGVFYPFTTKPLVV